MLFCLKQYKPLLQVEKLLKSLYAILNTVNVFISCCMSFILAPGVALSLRFSLEDPQEITSHCSLVPNKPCYNMVQQTLLNSLWDWAHGMQPLWLYICVKIRRNVTMLTWALFFPMCDKMKKNAIELGWSKYSIHIIHISCALANVVWCSFSQVYNGCVQMTNFMSRVVTNVCAVDSLLGPR